MDLHLLLMALEAIEHVCTLEKAKSESSNKASHKGRSEKATWYWIYHQSPQESSFEKHCNLWKKHGGTYTTHNTKDCCRYEKDRKEKSDFCTAKKGSNKPNPAMQNFAQLYKKLDKLKKTLKKSSKKSKTPLQG